MHDLTNRSIRSEIRSTPDSSANRYAADESSAANTSNSWSSLARLRPISLVKNSEKVSSGGWALPASPTPSARRRQRCGKVVCATTSRRTSGYAARPPDTSLRASYSGHAG